MWNRAGGHEGKFVALQKARITGINEQFASQLHQSVILYFTAQADFMCTGTGSRSDAILYDSRP